MNLWFTLSFFCKCYFINMTYLEHFFFRIIAIKKHLPPPHCNLIFMRIEYFDDFYFHIQFTGACFITKAWELLGETELICWEQNKSCHQLAREVFITWIYYTVSMCLIWGSVLNLTNYTVRMCIICGSRGGPNYPNFVYGLACSIPF